MPAGTGPSAGARRPRTLAAPAASRPPPRGPGPVRTGAVEEQQRSEAVQQLGQPVPPQVLAALLLARRHPAVPGWREAAPGPAGPAGGGRAEEPAENRDAGGRRSLKRLLPRDAPLRRAGRGKRRVTVLEVVTLAPEQTRLAPGRAPALRRFVGKANYTR